MCTAREYLYAAMGEGGLRALDVANIDNKDFSERIITAPVSPLGQRLYVKTKYAMAVATPGTLAIDPARKRNPKNEEGPIHPMYGFLYVADKYEGLVVVAMRGRGAILREFRPCWMANHGNNFLRRALTFNPEGALTGAHRIHYRKGSTPTYSQMRDWGGEPANPLSPR